MTFKIKFYATLLNEYANYDYDAWAFYFYEGLSKRSEIGEEVIENMTDTIDKRNNWLEKLYSSFDRNVVRYGDLNM